MEVMNMVYVIASVRVKTGEVDEFLRIFKSNALEVRKERGCIEYFPAVDIVSGLPPQTLDGNVVTIMEKWEDLKALSDHAASPHMAAYREKAKDLVEDLSIKVLREA
jgi:quinol monooxygenase YgiN